MFLSMHINKKKTKNIYKQFIKNFVYRKLREIFKSMDVNDSGTIKLGEVCTFYHMKYIFKKLSNLT